MRWRSLLLAGLLVLSAGCLSPGDEDATTDADGDEDSGPSTSWDTVTRSGTVTGVGTPAGSVSQGGGNTATWTVAEDTRILHLNVTTEGGELSIEYGSDCSTEDTVDCEHEATTEGGEVSLVHEDPAPSGWEAYFFLDTNAGEVDWELTATMGVVTG